MPKQTYRYRLGWRSIRAVVPGLTTARYKALAVDLAEAMRRFEIDTPQRAAMFIAQIAHESLGFRYTEEIASGAAYEGRVRDLGNTQPGDGKRFKGRSYIQITGRANYAALSRALKIDFLAHPKRLAEPRYAALAAAWWWKNHGLNALADSGDFLAVTREINGGTNGLADRQKYYRRARLVRRFLVPKRRPPV